MNSIESSPLLYIAIIGAMGTTAAALLRAYPKLLTSSSAPNSEFVSISGLRGLLAARVFVHHAQVSRVYFRDGTWIEPKSAIYAFAGTGCVGVFFMITGLLFWGKVLDGRVRFLPLLKSRVRRIVPLYTLSLVIILMTCAYESNFSIATDWSDLTLSVAAWLGAGLFGHPAINAIGTLTINCGVTWTLQYEWIYYLLLPFITVFSSPWRFASLSILFFTTLLCLRGIGYQTQYQALVVAVPFFEGMFAAYVVRHRPRFLSMPKHVASGLVVASFMLGTFLYKH